MSVSAADRARIDEQNTKTRDEYEARETETVRRKNNELKNAEARHNEEIQKLTEDFQKQVDKLQRRSTESLTSRDEKHRNSVEELKTFFTEQTRKKNQQAALERSALTDTFKREMTKEKEISAGQRENMMGKQTEELMTRDEQFSTYAQKSKESMNKAIDTNASKLRNAHEKESDILLSDKKETILDKNRELGEVKKSYQNQITDIKRQKDNQDKNWQQKYYDTVNGHNERDSENLLTRSALLKGERESIQDRYQKVLRDKTADMDQINDNFKGEVNDRVNAQVRSRDSQIQGLKDKIAHDANSQKKLSQLEKKHLVESYENRMTDIEAERTDYVQHMNDLVHRRVNDGRDKNDRLVRDANLNYRSQMNLINTRNREERKLLELDKENRLAHVTNSAESRVGRLMKETDQNTKELDRHYSASVDILKEGYAERLIDQREKVTEDRMKQSEAINKRVQNMGSNYQVKLDNLQAEHKDNLSKMREEHRRELRRIETNYKNFAADREKGHKVEKESIEQKYEAKIATIEEQFQQEKELTNKRHDEDIKSLSQRLSNYSRKA